MVGSLAALTVIATTGASRTGAELAAATPIYQDPSYSFAERYRSTDAAGNVETAKTLNLIVNPQASGTVGGRVPATLTLTLGPAASFGAFTPGVAHVYSASTTATVTSTAGDARLDVSDPGHLANGAFMLPSPLGVTAVPRTWSAPVANDTFTIGFTQSIGVNDALRSGSYSKTLTFTLSTTTP